MHKTRRWRMEILIETKIIELNTDSCFCDMLCDDVIHGLLANGYVLNITPCKYSDDKYTVMIEIGEIDDSFIQQPTEEIRK